MHGDDVASAGVEVSTQIVSKTTELIMEMIKVAIEKERNAKGFKPKAAVLSGGEVTYQKLKEGGEVTMLPSFAKEDYKAFLKKAKAMDIPVAAIQESGKENTISLFFNVKDKEAVNSIVQDIVREKLKQPEQTERMITIEKEQVEGFQMYCADHDIPVNFLETQGGVKCIFCTVPVQLYGFTVALQSSMLRQQHGFMSVMPSGRNMFREQFERVIPASSTANLYPFSFSGKTDENGFYLGRDKFGSNIIVDFDKRAEDKTNANTLILGNSGQGKSYLLKLILTNLRESGKNIICLDPEMEYVDLTRNLGGCFIDLMSGEYIINVLEPKSWDDGTSDDEDAPRAFKSKTKLSQHISFLRDFFRSYKDFTDREIDTIELLLIKLYEKFGISDDTDWSKTLPTDYPILSDFYELIEAEYKAFNPKEKSLYTAENLQNICLGLHSICKGAESQFFNGHTNITDNNFVTFGVKGLLQASRNIRNALLFNVLAYMSEQLLSRGNTVASIDEFYLFLTNLTAVEYIRNFMKRVRKKESAVILASQNIEDFLVENVRELTKPLFSIPTHIFLFYPGTIEKGTYMDTLQVEASEYGLIQFSQRGVCLYKCGNERYCLCVKAPDHKAALFGSAGGR